MSPILDATIRASFILVVGLLLDRCLRRYSAALRHCVLAASIAMAAAVVPLSLVVPSWDVVVPAPRPAADVHSAVVDSGAIAPATAPRADAFLPGAPAVPRAATVWLAGFVVAIGILIAGVLRLMRVT